MLLPRHKEIILNFWEHSSGPHHHHSPDKIESMTDPKPTLFFFLSTLPSLSHIKWFFSLSPELMIIQQTTQLVAQRLKHLPAMWETWVQSLGREDPLEKEMATHSSILAWRIPWTEEPGGLQSMGLQSRTRLSDFTSLHFTSLHFTSLHEGLYNNNVSCLRTVSPSWKPSD